MADLASESNDRSYRATALAIAVLGAMVALVIFVPELRALASDTWRELRSISRRWIAAIVIATVASISETPLTICPNARICAAAQNTLPGTSMNTTIAATMTVASARAMKGTPPTTVSARGRGDARAVRRG